MLRTTNIFGFSCRLEVSLALLVGDSFLSLLLDISFYSVIDVSGLVVGHFKVVGDVPG